MGQGKSKEPSSPNKALPPVDPTMNANDLAQLLCTGCPGKEYHYGTHQCAGCKFQGCSQVICMNAAFLCDKHPERGRVCAPCKQTVADPAYVALRCLSCYAEERAAEQKRNEEKVLIANRNLVPPPEYTEEKVPVAQGVASVRGEDPASVQ